MIKLNQLQKFVKRKAKRIGRGYGSTKGSHTSTRGSKGQKSRTGYKPPRKNYEGGQNYLSKRIPKLRGFRRALFNSKSKLIAINVSDLEALEAGTVINPASAREMLGRYKSKNLKFKILGKGDLTKKITVEDIQVSEEAKSKIEKAGGSIKQASKK